MTSEREFPPAWAVLLAMLALAAGLMVLPRRVGVQLRGGLGAALEPGQRVAGAVVRRTESGLAALAAARSSAEEVQSLRQALRDSEEEKRRLEQRLQSVIDEQPLRLASQWADVQPGKPLLVPRIQVARVLGDDATAFLAKHRVISLGDRDGIEQDALALEAPPEEPHTVALIDQGKLDGMENGFPVLWQRVVLGRVLEPGPFTSRVQLVRDGGFRAAVRLARKTDQGLLWGPSGVLEGTGGALCRLSHVRAQSPVEVGDLVLTAGNEAIVPEPLLYGRVVQCLLPPGGNTWEIWVRPASAGPRLSKVLVLAAQLNPERVSASRKTGR